MIYSQRPLYILIGTDEKDARHVWDHLTATERHWDAQARSILAAWAHTQIGAKVRSSHILSVTSATDPGIDGPYALEVVLEGINRSAVDSGDRLLSTMLLRRRGFIDAMLVNRRSALRAIP